MSDNIAGKVIIIAISSLILLFSLLVPAAYAASAQPEELRMWMTVGERRFAVTLTDHAAARSFAAQLPLALDMSELNGNEKHADLPKPLPANASLPGTIRNGDLMLYGADTLFQGLSRWTGWNMSRQTVQRTARRKLA